MSIDTKYLNTDLNLRALFDLTPLVGEFEAARFFVLHAGKDASGEWSARIETSPEYDEPESNLAAFADFVEALEGQAQTKWRECSTREFDIGFEVGTQPFSFHGAIANATLRRVANVGASLRITVYRAEPMT